MEIKSTSGYKAILFFCGFWIALVDAIFLITDGFSGFSIFMLIVTGIFIWISVCLWIAYSRTFLFDETGCTVSLGKYKKHYSWAKLRFVELRDCRNTFYFNRTENKPEEIMVFSQNPIKFPRWIDISYYAIFFHPLSCIFVGFYTYPQENSTILGKSFEGEKIYIAPKKELLQKLSEWGVKVEI